jgi:hypothetical protein
VAKPDAVYLNRKFNGKRSCSSEPVFREINIKIKEEEFVVNRWTWRGVKNVHYELYKRNNPSHN